ncbi:hypothetical protein CI102_4065 [Trichoderma harzianum]|nr:hypothetical protein CI102_4065 [Trichoderma harzianum]
MLVSKHTSSKRLITKKSFAWQTIGTSCPGQRDDHYYRYYSVHACNICNLLYEHLGREPWNSEQVLRKGPRVRYSSHGLPPKEVLFCPFFIVTVWTDSRRTNLSSASHLMKILVAWMKSLLSGFISSC